jgi:hypothetical protein
MFTFKSLDYLVNTCADWKTQIGFSKASLKQVVPRVVLLPSGHLIQIGHLTKSRTKTLFAKKIFFGRTNCFLDKFVMKSEPNFDFAYMTPEPIRMTPREAFTILKAKFMTPALQAKSDLFDELGCYSIEDFIYLEKEH